MPGSLTTFAPRQSVMSIRNTFRKRTLKEADTRIYNGRISAQAIDTVPGESMFFGGGGERYFNDRHLPRAMVHGFVMQSHHVMQILTVSPPWRQKPRPEGYKFLSGRPQALCKLLCFLPKISSNAADILANTDTLERSKCDTRSAMRGRRWTSGATLSAAAGRWKRARTILPI